MMYNIYDPAEPLVVSRGTIVLNPRTGRGRFVSEHPSPMDIAAKSIGSFVIGAAIAAVAAAATKTWLDS